MSQYIFIINPGGATLRSGPSKSGGTVRRIAQGESFPVETVLPADPVSGEQWVKLAGKFSASNALVNGYCVLKVGNTVFGVLVGEAEKPTAQDKSLARAELNAIKLAIEERLQALA